MRRFSELTEPPVRVGGRRFTTDRGTTTNNHKGTNMPLIEKELADDLVDLREQEHLGTLYAPIADIIAAKQHHLDREQWWRAQIGATAELAAAGGAERPDSAAR